MYRLQLHYGNQSILGLVHVCSLNLNCVDGVYDF